MMFCTKCGAENADGSLFCGSCGAPVRNPGLRPDAEAKPAAPGKRKRTGLIIGLAALTVVIAIVEN